MFPVICQIGPFRIYSYGLLFAIAVLVTSYLLNREAKARGMNPEIISDLVFWLVIGGIIGARLFYIVLYLPFFLQNPAEIVMIHHGGLAWQGGLICALLIGIWFVKKHKLSLPSVLDLVAPYIALGEAIGRIGCFLNGCCYGREVSWGIYFPVHGARLHPTQLYTSAGLLLIFFILKRLRRFPGHDGRIFCTYLLLASLLRFIVEFYRADHDILWAGLSIYQIVSLVIVIVAFYANTYFKGLTRK